jgi:glycosyltransferase involved in cell wall biosynthesis
VIRIYTSEYPPRVGGVATILAEWAQALARRGWEVRVRCPAIRAAAQAQPVHAAVAGHAAASVHIEPVANRGTRDPDDLWRWHWLLRSELTQPAVHLLGDAAPIEALLWGGWGWLSPARRVEAVLYGSEIARWRRHPLLRHRFAGLLRRLDRIWVISDYTAGLLRGNVADPTARVPPGGAAAPPARVPPGGAAAPLERGPPGGGVVAGKVVRLPLAPRSGWQVGWDSIAATGKFNRTSPVRILTAARLHPRKGHLEVLAALQRWAPALRTRVIYRIVGDGRSAGYRRQLQQQAAALQQRGVLVDFVGARHGEDLRREFLEANLFVMVSRPDPLSIESFGMVYLEAAACGTPVIAADVGGVREAVQAGGNALLVPPLNAPALDAALDACIHDPQQRRRMAETGWQWAGQFNWDAAASLFT